MVKQARRPKTRKSRKAGSRERFERHLPCIIINSDAFERWIGESALIPEEQRTEMLQNFKKALAFQSLGMVVSKRRTLNYGAPFPKLGLNIIKVADLHINSVASTLDAACLERERGERSITLRRHLPQRL